MAFIFSAAVATMAERSSSALACEDGYSLQSWTGGVFACTQYACDPAFLHD